MSATTFMYEGDGLVHTAPRRPATPKTRPAEPKAPAATEPATEVAASTAERRSEALRRFFPKIGAWLADRVYFARMRDVEQYLSQATDEVDLEARIRRVERGMLTRY